MKRFATLLDRLTYAPARNDKLRLITSYLREVPDPDRGWALAALTDGLPFSFPVRRVLGELMADRLDPLLYSLSRDYVGDTAETVALAWPETRRDSGAFDAPTLAEVVETLRSTSPRELGTVLVGWLDRLDATGRWALLKLLTGALRVGVSARLGKTAAAALGSHSADEVEAVWHGLVPPYRNLFAWLEGRGVRPDVEKFCRYSGR